MKISDYYLNQPATFENRLLYAMYLSPYDCNADYKWGYLDASKELLESHRDIEWLEEYIKGYEAINSNPDDYTKAYILAYKDYIKQEKESVTNE